jgi:hypothetical protein
MTDGITVAATLTGVTNSVTRILVGVLVLAAALVVVVGLFRARYGRRLPQLVIADMADADWLATSVTPGLSSLLRQHVRRRLSEPSGPDSRSLAKTVQSDIEGGIFGLSYAAVSDFAQIDAGLIRPDAGQSDHEVLAAQRDELSLVSGGIHALAPDRADGLVGALSVALPAQRGLIVTSTPLAREVGGCCQIGLTIDAGPLGRGPNAAATFWSDSIPCDDVTDKDLAQRTKLLGLLEPAAIWIALYVVGENLTVQSARDLPRGIHRKQRREGVAREREALRAILTAQLAGYEMNRMKNRPAAALGFSEQAIEDAHRAMRALPTYHRPHYIAGMVHSHRGTCYDILRSGEVLTPTATVLDTYRRAAATSYGCAEEAFRRAEALVTTSGDAGAAARAATVRQGIRIQRLKAALHGEDPASALDDLDHGGVTPMTADQRYTAACLYSAAAKVSADLGRSRQSYDRLTLLCLAQTAVSRPDYLADALTDPELVIGLDRASVDKLCAVARSPRVVEIAAQDQERAVRAIMTAVTAGPGPALPHQPTPRRRPAVRSEPEPRPVP